MTLISKIREIIKRAALGGSASKALQEIGELLASTPAPAPATDTGLSANDVAKIRKVLDENHLYDENATEEQRDKRCALNRLGMLKRIRAIIDAAPPTPASGTATNAGLQDGVSLIDAERQRQITAEGWTPEHDDEHNGGEIAKAAACYATPDDHRILDVPFQGPRGWPWGFRSWKPSPNDRVRELVKAGALIAAEIDRLQRADAPTPSASPADATKEGTPLPSDYTVPKGYRYTGEWRMPKVGELAMHGNGRDVFAADHDYKFCEAYIVEAVPPEQDGDAGKKYPRDWPEEARRRIVELEQKLFHAENGCASVSEQLVNLEHDYAELKRDRDALAATFCPAHRDVAGKCPWCVNDRLLWAAKSLMQLATFIGYTVRGQGYYETTDTILVTPEIKKQIAAFVLAAEKEISAAESAAKGAKRD